MAARGRAGGRADGRAVAARRGAARRVGARRGASGRVGARRDAARRGAARRVSFNNLFSLGVWRGWECGGLGVWRWSGTRRADLLVPMPSPIKVLSNILI